MIFQNQKKNKNKLLIEWQTIICKYTFWFVFFFVFSPRLDSFFFFPFRFILPTLLIVGHDASSQEFTQSLWIVNWSVASISSTSPPPSKTLFGMHACGLPFANSIKVVKVLNWMNIESVPSKKRIDISHSKHLTSPKKKLDK